MILAIINSLDTFSPLPAWLVVIVLTIIFIIVSLITGYLTFKYRVNRTNEDKKEKMDNYQNNENT